jgi:tetratricopeptide (TPR) repeat protein
MSRDAQHNSAWNAFIEVGFRAHMNGCYREAEQIYKTALRLADQAHVIFHSSTAQTLSLLADLYADQQHFAAAERLYRLALLVFEHIDGLEPIDTAITLKRLSEICHLQDKTTEALELNERAEAIIASMRIRLDQLFFKTFVAEN